MGSPSKCVAGGAHACCGAGGPAARAWSMLAPGAWPHDKGTPNNIHPSVEAVQRSLLDHEFAGHIASSTCQTRHTCVKVRGQMGSAIRSTRASIPPRPTPSCKSLSLTCMLKKQSVNQ
eukprot:1161340-Pelagomonas_calceolata.AAC.12